MTRFALEAWDSGRLTVNGAFVPLLQRHGWTTFARIWEETANAAIAKNLRTDRVTLSFSLNDEGGERKFYIKRHSRSSWKEYVKPLLRLTWPILGARNEWNAILAFHAARIPTMVPVALGESGSNSFLVTESLENCEKLSRRFAVDSEWPVTLPERTQILRNVARLARQMHSEGMHHQDFYLGHLMQSRSQPELIHIIDLGRVQRQRPLAQRWIVKDLAQLNFSAATASTRERLQFLKGYLDRPLKSSDRRLISQIESKTASIARHSRKNKL
ncbi:lipopolysaccharide kinase InaA family protein [Schlesneria sp. DSM 10557]|uniref:lipopolysaccharide kinase InaA family protein n=1 Tax=Schlesneria sp. DSM 10557 TaxID=3044399 RepID=UPI0035A1ADDC